MGRVFLTGGKVEMSDPLFPKKGTALNDCTWEQIAMVSSAGLANEYFKVGDTKTLKLNGKVGALTFTNLSVDAVIIGINHNSVIEGDNRIHFQIGRISGADIAFIDSYYDDVITDNTKVFCMNAGDNYGTAGGWERCDMRNIILSSFRQALPSELIANMKTAIKYTDNTGDGKASSVSYVTPTTDYMWLLSAFEVYGATKGANSYEQNYQKQYEYYSAGNSKARRKHNDTGTSCMWWLRSANCTSDEQFIAANSSSTSDEVCYASYGVAPAFCV